MIRLSLETLWKLQETSELDELQIIESIHDYMFCDMMYTDVRYASYYDARLDKIQLLPLKDMTMEKTDKKMTTKKENDWSKSLINVIDVLKPTLVAARAWIKALTRGDK